MYKGDRLQKKQTPLVNEPKKDFKTIKEHFKNIDNMKDFLRDGCQDFNENFELLNYINSGSCGVVYEGKIKRSPNKRVGLKFLMGKMYCNGLCEIWRFRIFSEKINSKEIFIRNINSIYYFTNIGRSSILSSMQNNTYGY